MGAFSKLKIAEPYGHPFDQRWGEGVICWDKKRECWVLPGGEITRIENKALEAARRIAHLIENKQTFIRKIAA